MKTRHLPLFTATVVAFFGASSSFSADLKQNWETHCMKCHGADGKGNTRMGKQSGVKDYTNPKVQAEMKDDNGALKVVKEGIVEKGKKKMDPYADKLSEQEMKELIAHMRSFGKKQ